MSTPLVQRLAQIGRTLESRFLGKDEVIRLLLITTIAGEHAVLIGPPGTAKSALLRDFARLMQARYFEYLLTRFTEPNEIFGPVDIAAFREGRYERRVEGMLPTAEIVFLDEVFKSNSAILNAPPHAPQRAPLHLGRRGAALPAALVFRRFERGSRRRDARRHLRPLLAAHPQRPSRRVPLPGSAPARHRKRDPRHGPTRRSSRSPPLHEIAELHRGFGAAHALFRRVPQRVQGPRLPDPRRRRVALSDRRAVKMLKLFRGQRLSRRTAPARRQ